MNKESKNYVIDILTSMVVEALSERQSRDFTEVFREFRRSRTYKSLLNPETGLWMNGPDYIEDEYDIETGSDIQSVMNSDS